MIENNVENYLIIIMYLIFWISSNVSYWRKCFTNKFANGRCRHSIFSFNIW